jgi:hypothetical protein
MKKLLLSILLAPLILVATPALSATVTFVAEVSGNGNNAGGNPNGNLTLNCGAGENRYVRVVTGVNDATNAVSGITYNGVALSQIGAKLVTGSRAQQQFYLVSAASGSNTLTITLSASDQWAAIASCWSGVDPVSPHGTEAQTTSSTTSITTDATGVANGVVIDGIVKGLSTEVAAEGANQTEIVASGQPDNGNLRVHSSYESGAGTKTMSWSWASSTSTSIRAIPVLPAADTATGAIRRRNQ